jgi:hypothetical protein
MLTLEILAGHLNTSVNCEKEKLSIAITLSVVKDYQIRGVSSLDEAQECGDWTKLR